MANKRHRTEKDSMGDVLVPLNAMYGAQTQRAVDNFTILNIPMQWQFIAALLLIKKAAATTNLELELLTSDAAQCICRTVDLILKEKPHSEFPVSVFQTGSGTSTNMNVNEVIAGYAKQQGVTLSPNDQINLGQSSNDVIPATIHTAAALATRNHLLPSIKELAAIIAQYGEDHKDVIKTGRTHLMDALPISFQQELNGWVAQLDECVERIESTMPRLMRLPLGGTAVGSGVNCHPAFAEKTICLLATYTGLPLTQAISNYKGISSLDTVVELSGALKTCAIVLSKISNDLRWMNSGPLSGLGEIRLPALQPGSSIMPAKVNPVIPEAVCMACALVIGNDTTISLGGMAGNFQLNTMLPVVGDKILESINILANSCHSLGEKAIKDMTVNREVYDHALLYNPILVTSLNPVVGYMKAAEIGKIAQKENRTVLDVALEKTSIAKEVLEELLDPKVLAAGNMKREG